MRLLLKSNKNHTAHTQRRNTEKEEGNKGRKEEKELFDFVRESLGWTVDYPWDNVAVAAT